MTLPLNSRLQPWSLPRVGLAVVGEEVSGILVRRSTILRAASYTLVAPGELAQLHDALDRVLTELALPRFRRRSAFVALGGTHVQTRHLTHLPPIGDDAVLARLLQTNVGRFFRKNGKPLAVSRPEIIGPSEGWASATEAPLLEQLRASCALHGVQLKAAVPAALTLGIATADATATWMEQDVRIDVRYTAGRRLAHVRLTKTTASTPRGEPWIPTLRRDVKVPAARELTVAFLAALGAALESPSEPLAIRAGSTVGVSRHSPLRLLAATMALVLGLLALLVAPIAGTHRAAIAARARMRRVASQERAAQWTSRELSRTTATLRQLATFSRHRRSAVLAMESLANALPEDASLQSVRFDDLGGNLVALSSDAADLLAAVDSVPEVKSATIVGSVAPEIVNGERLQRVTIRFEWKNQKPGSASTVRRTSP